MLCGGEVTVFLEPYRPQPVLMIVGGGHIGQPLAELARIVGYKVGIVLDHLWADGFTEQALGRVRAPIGLNLGGREPAEIALSILAEIESVRHGASAEPRSGTKTAVWSAKRVRTRKPL